MKNKLNKQKINARSLIKKKADMSRRRKKRPGGGCTSCSSCSSCSSCD